MTMTTRILWDAVPADVQAELELRTDVKPKGVAIITRNEGRERWYFRKEQFGWNNISVDREANAQEAASDLTDEQRAEAKAQVAKIEEALKKRFAPKPSVMVREATDRCPAHTDGKHVYNRRIVHPPQMSCTCGKVDPSQTPAPNSFNYCNDSEVVIQIDTKVERMPTLGGRVVSGPRITTTATIRMPLYKAVKDGWMGVDEFEMVYHTDVPKMRGQVFSVEEDHDRRYVTIEAQIA